VTAAGIEYSDHGWISAPDDPAKPIAGEVTCDVVIVGGGYTGMAAALHLAELEVDVVLLESAFCGYGASSRNAGHLTPTIAGDPQILATVYKRRAPELIRVADHAVHFTESLIEELGIECDYEPTGNVSATLTPGQHKRAQRIARILQASGGDVEFVEGPEWGLPATFTGGILERSGGLLNPGKFVRGLRHAVLRSRARVSERTHVESIESRADGVEVRTTHGARVRASKALIATNAYSRDLPSAPRRLVAPLWVTLAETEPIGRERLLETGWTSGSGLYTQHVVLESYRPTVEGTVVFGTRQVQVPKGRLGGRRPDPRILADLIRGLCDRFPSLEDVSVRRTWGGWIAMTPSWLPVAGEAAPNTLYLAGYNGHGLAQGPYLGTLVADVLAGGDRHDDLQALWRQRPRFAPAVLYSSPALKAAWAFDRVYDRITRDRGGDHALLEPDDTAAG
jgi:glycine/D-amino acid oxidase-like deaminating enzyme